MGTIVPDVQYDRQILTLQGSVVQNGNTYRATFKTGKNLGGGVLTGKINFRLCQQASCATVYPGSSQEFAYTLNSPLKDWETQQRNASHNGYVHARLNAAAFKKAWEWAPPYTENLSVAASKGGDIFVTRRHSDRTTSVQALVAADGTSRWSRTLGQVHDGASPPAVSGNQLYVATMVTSSDNNSIHVLDTGTGQFVRRMRFASQWSNFAPPTPFGADVYFAAGYYGGVVYSYDASTGALRWTGEGGGGDVWDGLTPAVDQNYVYYYSGQTVDVFNRTNGARVKSIQNPFFNWGGYSYVGGPILGARRNVIVYSGSYTGGQQRPRPLASFSTTGSTSVWQSQDVYVTTPALAKGVLYVARNSPARLDALNEETGAVLWSWSPPTGSENFAGNIVVADNLVFVSTTQKIYAISTTDQAHSVAWSADTPGLMSISSDSMLIVAVREGDRLSGNRLVGYKLY